MSAPTARPSRRRGSAVAPLEVQEARSPPRTRSTRLLDQAERSYAAVPVTPPPFAPAQGWAAAPPLPWHGTAAQPPGVYVLPAAGPPAPGALPSKTWSAAALHAPHAKDCRCAVCSVAPPPLTLEHFAAAASARMSDAARRRLLLLLHRASHAVAVRWCGRCRSC